jgi:hypothetical protein
MGIIRNAFGKWGEAMISVRSIVYTVRWKENDNDEAVLSDYDIIHALNECLRYLAITLSNKNTEYLIKCADLSAKDMWFDTSYPYIVFLTDSGERLRVGFDFENGTTTFDLEEADEKEQEVAAEGLARFGTVLPADYISLKAAYRLPDGYKMHTAASIKDMHHTGFLMQGGRIYSLVDLRLYYHAALAEIDIADMDAAKGCEIDLPVTFFDLIVKLTRLILNNGDNDTMTQAFEMAVDRMIPRRRYSNARQKMPFWM